MRITQLITASVFAIGVMGPCQITKSLAAERAVSGAWIQGGERCEEVFTRAGKSLSFKKPVDSFAPAFIISGNQVRTPNASCRIKGSKQSGDRRILALVCATSVAVDEAQARLEPLADGTLRRYLNAADKVGTKYERCS
jgi:hypothetical protein